MAATYYPGIQKLPVSEKLQLAIYYKKKKLSLYGQNKTLTGASGSAPVSDWPLLDCSLTHWNVSSTKAESLPV